MPLPKGLARFNRVVTNRITRPFAGVLPGFAVVVHHGRRTGAEYHTPVNAFRQDNEFVLVLTYSSHTDWVANVRAAGRCELVHVRRRIPVERPELLTGDAATQRFPALLRPLLRLLRVDEAMIVRRLTPDAR